MSRHTSTLTHFTQLMKPPSSLVTAATLGIFKPKIPPTCVNSLVHFYNAQFCIHRFSYNNTQKAFVHFHELTNTYLTSSQRNNAVPPSTEKNNVPPHTCLHHKLFHQLIMNNKDDNWPQEGAI